MPIVLSVEQIRKIQRLAKTRTDREVACIVGVARGTVKRYREMRHVPKAAKREQPAASEKNKPPKVVEPYTCPGCHRWVYYRPCQVCRALAGCRAHV